MAEYGNDRVQMLTLDGKFIAKFGEEGSKDGQFRKPESVCVDNTGRVLVAAVVVFLVVKNEIVDPAEAVTAG